MLIIEAIYSLILGVGILYAILMFFLGGLCKGFPLFCSIWGTRRPASLSRYNPLTTASTLIAFGATGLSLTAALAVGIVTSLFFSVLFAWLMNQATYKLVAKGFANVHGTDSERSDDLPGYRAEVINEIEPGATGEISFLMNGAITHHPARLASGDKTIPRGAIVVVVAVEEGTALVKIVE